MKLKTLVAAVALVAAGAANASINVNDLIFQAWDTTSNMSYVADLGIANTSAPSAINFTLAAADLTTLLGTDTTGANLNWNVYGTDGTGNVWSTQAAGGAPTLDQYSIVTLAQTLASVSAGINGLAPFTTAATKAGTTASGTTAAPVAASPFGTGIDYSGNFLLGNASGTSFGTVDFYSYLYNNFVAGTAPVKLGTVTFSASGLVGPAVSSVPLPAAAWLFGSGLMGLIGIARRRKTA